MELFSKGVLPIKVSLDEATSYEAGALKVAVASSVAKAANKSLVRFTTERFNWNDKTSQFDINELSWDAQVEYEVLNSISHIYEKISTVMAASSTGVLSPEKVVLWFCEENDFFNQCYDAAIELNPTLALPEEQAADNPTTEEGATEKN